MFKADVPSVAKIVGHNDTRTTYKYANHTVSEKVVKTAEVATGLVQELVDGLDSDE